MAAGNRYNPEASVIWPSENLSGAAFPASRRRSKVAALRKGAVAVTALLALQMLAGACITLGETPATATPIKHVVIVMMENHSFDNLFGLYPTLNRTEPGTLLGALQAPDDVLNAPKGLGLSQVPNGTYFTANPNEDVYRQDWDGGKMDGFTTYGGSQAMTYFGPSQLAVEWDWAEEYSIADRYFSSCLCMTNPNRLYSLAGSGTGLTNDAGPPPFVPANESIFAELNGYGVSWGYYLRDPVADISPLDYFGGIGAYSSQIQGWSSFYSALQQGTLPAVSWVMPVGGGASGVSQHPSDNMTEGEVWLLKVVNGVMQSRYWNSSAIFVNYDEGGGYYDHVPPPELDGVQLGFRVPLFVISPYAKENYVSHTVMNHASVLAFIEYNWGLPALNAYVADSGLPLDMFDFNRTYPGGTLERQPIVLTNSSRYPADLQIPLVDLPYQRSGSSGATLGTLGVKLYTGGNGASPSTADYLAVAAAGALLVVVYVAVKLAKRPRERRYR